MIKINGAWYLNNLPNHIIMETQDGQLSMFTITPFRQITDSDLSQYKGYHPRKCKGNPLPNYLYKFYGLEKSEETMTEVLRVRLTPSEFEHLKKLSQNNNMAVSEYMRNIIKKL